METSYLEQHKNLMRMIAGAALWALATSTWAADDCSAILEQGIRNTYQTLDKTNLKSGVSNAVCNSSSSSTGGNSGGGLGLTIPIEGVPVNFNGNYSESKLNSVKNAGCSSSSSSLSDDQFHTVLSMVADTQIVAAWESCKAKAGGVYMNATLNGNLVVFELRFRPVGNVNSTTISTPPQFFGVTCNSPVYKKDVEVTNSPLQQACLRDGSGEVTGIVNTKWDAGRVFIPAIQKAPTRGSGTDAFGNKINTSPDWPPPVTISMCLIPKEVYPNMKDQAACPFEGNPGAKCSCPEFDGKGGVNRFVDGTSVPPTDPFWAWISSTRKRIVRGK